MEECEKSAQLVFCVKHQRVMNEARRLLYYTRCSRSIRSLHISTIPSPPEPNQTKNPLWLECGPQVDVGNMTGARIWMDGPWGGACALQGWKRSEVLQRYVCLYTHNITHSSKFTDLDAMIDMQVNWLGFGLTENKKLV